MNTFVLRSKSASFWKLDVIGMSLAETIDYIRECWLSPDTASDCVVVWDADSRNRIAEVYHDRVWISREWLYRLDEDSQVEKCERYHEKY